MEVMTWTAILNSRGQVTLPKKVRDRLGLKTGDKLNCSVVGDGEIVLSRKNLDVSDLVGLLHVPGTSATIEQIGEAAQDSAAAKLAEKPRRR